MLVRKPDPERTGADVITHQVAKPAAQAGQRVLSANARTTLDGGYTIRDIPPGDYFVVAMLAGYIAPILTVERTDNLDRILAGTPTVHVVSDRESIADLTLRRGGTIAGTVQFDDGTSLVGGTVRAEQLSDTDHPSSDDEPVRFATSVTADDLGHYRVSGLPPGKYRIYLDIQIAGGMRLSAIGGPGSNQYSQSSKGSVAMHLFVYQPGTLRRSKAAAFEIKHDEEIAGADLRVELDGLHSVTGRVAARESPCGFAMALAVVVDDDDKDFYRTVDLEPDGSFQISFVPNGKYTLRIVGAICVKPPTVLAAEELEKDRLRRFKVAELPILVMDRDVDADRILLDDLVVKPGLDQ
jgi:hypothetical protein